MPKDYRAVKRSTDEDILILAAIVSERLQRDESALDRYRFFKSLTLALTMWNDAFSRKQKKTDFPDAAKATRRFLDDLLTTFNTAAMEDMSETWLTEVCGSFRVSRETLESEFSEMALVNSKFRFPA